MVLSEVDKMIQKLNNNYLKLSLFFLTFSVIITLYFLSLASNSILLKDLLSFCVFLFALLLLVVFNDIPIFLVCLILFQFLIKSIYSYNLYTTIVSPFPDTFKYLSGLDVMEQSRLDIESVFGIAQSLQFGYYYLIFVIYKLFGTIYSLYLVNIFLFSISVILFFKIIKSDFSLLIAKCSTVALLLSSNMLLFTSNILKDALVVFLIMTCFYIYKVRENRKFTLFVCILLLFTVRIYAGASVVAAILIDYFVYNWSKISFKKKFISVSLLTLMFFLLFRFPIVGVYFELIKIFFTGTSLVDLLLNPFVAIIKMFFAPLPWNLLMNPNIYLITIFDSLMFLMFSFGVVLFIVKILKFKELRKRMFFYLIPICIHAVALGIQYDGDSTRQRVGVLALIILVYVVGILYKNKSINKRDVVPTL